MSYWMQVSNGQVFYPFECGTQDFHIEAIAHALSNQCRFAGHCLEFYSVAQHSCLVSDNVRWEKLAALLHDAAEAYLLDIPRPLKHSGMLDEYKRLENQMMVKIAGRFDFDWPMSEEVVYADNVLLATEKRDLMAPCELEWEPLPDPLPERIVPWAPHIARSEFLRRFRELTDA